MASRSSTNLYVRDLESGGEHLLTPHEGPGSFGGGLFSPDGATVYLSSNLDRDLIAFGRVRLGSDGEPGPIEILAERDDAELQSMAAHQGRRHRGPGLERRRPQRAGVPRSGLRRARTAGPELPAEIVGGLDFSDDGGKLAMVISGSAAPADIWVLDRAAVICARSPAARTPASIWRRWCGPSW